MNRKTILSKWPYVITVASVFGLVGALYILLKGVIFTPDRSFTEIQSPVTRLMDPFDSFTSFEAVSKMLEEGKIEFKVVDQGWNKEDKRPPFHFVTVRFKTEHLGVSGGAVLTFFNNRLLETKFFPDEVSKYLSQLESKLGREFKKEAKIPPFTKITDSRDPEGRVHYIFVDERLEREVKLWLMHYSLHEFRTNPSKII